MQTFTAAAAVALVLLVAQNASCRRLTRQASDDDGLLCCKCIDKDAFCSTNAGDKVTPGVHCEDSVDGEASGKSSTTCPVPNSLVAQVIVPLSSGSSEKCGRHQQNCCDKVTNTFGPKLDERPADGKEVCKDDKVAATTDFTFGQVCGKRDSQAYKDVEREEEHTNPGEWPWAALIFDGDKHVGTAALVEKNTVVTVAHRVRSYLTSPEKLTVRLGEWNPTSTGRKGREEEYPHVDLPVECIKIHPKNDPDNSFVYNVAVLKLGAPRATSRQVVDVITTLSAILPGDDSGEAVVPLDVNAEVILNNDGNTNVQGERQTHSYINSVCLPEPGQFSTQRCWMTSWGKGPNILQRQREVDIPLLTREDCNNKLAPEFAKRGVRGWDMSPSEICAGEKGKDTCIGEGGAPLVCLDEDHDQYYLAGLVNFALQRQEDCGGPIPDVFVNMADKSIKDFVTSSYEDTDFCDT